MTTSDTLGCAPIEPGETLLDLAGVAKAYGEGAKRFVAVRDVSLCIKAGEFVCLLGPSGCGKSTLLRIIAGLNTATSGTADYRGKPFQDSVYKAGAQVIPGKLECAYYDLGGEGIAYHNGDAINHGSGELNLKPEHQRPEASPYLWTFREKEGVDISYTKDFADLNRQNLSAPDVNQLYIGWTKDGEWCNYTVNVKAAGTYRITALYANAANKLSFSINNKTVCDCKCPIRTAGMHHWNKALIGTITFPKKGLQLLTFHYNAGSNFAYFEFESAETK
jgi:energy-coupling factor transporter ATP-binding protein EcfA2